MNGNFAGGDGSTSNPYLIEDAQDLDAVRNNLNKAYKLIKDIDLGVSPYNEGEGWKCVSPFSGILNGNGHIIKNLYINKPDNTSGNATFIYGTHSGTINNLGIDSFNVIVKKNGSILANNIHLIENCFVRNGILDLRSIDAVNGNSGLIANSLQGTGDSIKNCYAEGTVYTGSNYQVKRIGGVVGYGTDSSNIIENCYSLINIIGSFEQLSCGGCIGWNYNETGISNYYDSTILGYIGNTISSTPKTTVQMKDPSNFTDWDKQMLDDGITPVWKLKEGEYPKLWFEKPPIKYLIKDNNKYKYTQDGNVLNTIANEDTLYNNFNTYGMNDLTNINENIINVLENSKYNISMLR